MKKLLLIALLIVGCDKETPVTSEKVYGCTDNTAENFNYSATYDNGSCEYGSHNYFGSFSNSPSIVSHYSDQKICSNSTIYIQAMAIDHVAIQKVEFYIEKTKLKMINVLKELQLIIPETLQSYSWQKSMKWSTYDLSWARPLKSIICLFNNKVIHFNFFHLNHTI